MIILRIPKRINSRSLKDFILLQVKKFRKNQRHKYIQLRGEVAYSNSYVYFILEPYQLELAFALSILLKCRRHNIPCELYLSKPIELNKLPREVIEVAKTWSERKLQRRYYRLRDIRL